MDLKAAVALLGVAVLWHVGVTPRTLRAQPAGAVLSGVVRDTSGAALAKAKVSVRNVTSGQSIETETDTAGTYSVPNLAPGSYAVAVSAEGFLARTADVTFEGGAARTLDVTLESSSGNAVRPSLGDLGFPAEQAQGSAADQARLDKRSHMLKIHQRLGLITIAPLVATIIASSMAGGRHSTATGRDVHARIGHP